MKDGVFCDVLDVASKMTPRSKVVCGTGTVVPSIQREK